MNRFIKSVCCVFCIIAFLACKKERTQKFETPTKMVSFKNIPFNIEGNHNELYFNTNEEVTLFASTDTVNSQIKSIENSPSQRLFMVAETDDFYEVDYFTYGDHPLSYRGYVRIKDFILKEQHTLEYVDLKTIRYSNFEGTYDDQTKSFEKYGTVKLINKATYQQNKRKGNTPYIFSTKDVAHDLQLDVYSFRTNSGEQVEIPLKTVDEETGTESVRLVHGFSPILQAYVFKITEDKDVSYAFYSKRNKQEKVQYKKELPIYNKTAEQFAELTNDNDVGCLLVISGLDNNFRFKEKLLVNFVNFKIIPNTIYWINDKTLISEAIHTNQKDELSKVEYLMIQLK